jgi:SAM-dependent methyltransferase
MNTKHLDLGCGLSPRNPYLCQEVYGCDIREIDADVEAIGFNYRRANVVTDPIPFPDDFFDSVSAFDFFEHVPRQVIFPSGKTGNPFVELMNEIHRVLKPGGRLLAATPAYPHASAFTDPTHVNFITQDTHNYFVGKNPGAAMYGFKGEFEIIKAVKDTPSNSYHPNEPNLRKNIRRIHRKLFREGLSHMIWEFKKPTAIV